MLRSTWNVHADEDRASHVGRGIDAPLHLLTDGPEHQCTADYSRSGAYGRGLRRASTQWSLFR